MKNSNNRSRGNDTERTAITRRLGEFAASLTYNDLPEKLVDRLKTDALDGVAVGLLGSTLTGVQLADKYWEEIGGTPQASIWGRGSKIPVPWAVLANSHAMESFQYEDTYVWNGIGTHQGCNVVPAAIAISELLGGVSGRDFVTALAAGHEVSVRIMKGITDKRRGFYHTGISSTFGAAATAGHLLKLDAKAMTWALGSAGAYVGGLLTIPSHSMVKTMINARAAEGGALAAILAERGFTGVENLLEAKQGGFYSTFTDVNDMSPLAEDLGSLGKTYYSEHVHTKRYPMCTSIHAPLEATCELVNTGEFSAEDVSRIVVKTTSTAQTNTVGYEPKTLNSAQLNMAYGIAIAILTGDVLPKDVTDESLQDPAVQRIMRMVEPVKDPELDAQWEGFAGPSRVEISLDDGRVLKSRVVPQASRMTNEEIETKARVASGHALSAEASEKLIQFFRTVEELDTVDSLFGLLHE